MYELDEFFYEYKNGTIIKIVSKDNTKVLFKYKSGLSDWTNHTLLKARGIVFDINGKVIIRPFTKFFNYHQYNWMIDNNYIENSDTGALSAIKTLQGRAEVARMAQWPEKNEYSNVRVYEKADGSMMNVSVYNNEIICTSSGSIDGTYPEYFKSALLSHLTKIDKLNEFKKDIENKTIVFEFINPMLDKHVVKYDNSDLVLLGAFNNETGKDYEFTNLLSNVAEKYYFTRPKYYNEKTEKDVLQLVEKMNNNENVVEGVVAVFQLNDNTVKRLKFKTSKYLELHHIMDALSYSAYTQSNALKIYNLIENDKLDDMLAEFDTDTLSLHAVAEYKKLYDKHYKIKDDIDKYIKNTPSFLQKMQSRQRKEIISDIKEKYGTFGVQLVSQAQFNNIDKIILSEHEKFSNIIAKEIKQVVKQLKKEAAEK